MRGNAASACSPRSATPSISARSVSRSMREQPRAGVGAMPRDAAERPLFANRRNRRAADFFGTGRLRHRRQLALAAERRQRGHRGHRRGGVVLAGLLDQLAERVIAHAAFRLVADDVGEHRRIADARHRHAADARVGVVLRERVERLEVGRDPARGSLRCECWDRGAWIWTGGGACREFPWVFQTPAALARAPAGAFLVSVSGQWPVTARGVRNRKDGIIALSKGSKGSKGSNRFQRLGLVGFVG